MWTMCSFGRMFMNQDWKNCLKVCPCFCISFVHIKSQKCNVFHLCLHYGKNVYAQCTCALSCMSMIGIHTYIEWQEVHTQALHIDSLLENISFIQHVLRRLVRVIHVAIKWHYTLFTKYSALLGVFKTHISQEDWVMIKWSWNSHTVNTATCS